MSSQYPNDPPPNDPPPNDAPRWRTEDLAAELRAGLWAPVVFFAVLTVALGIVIVVWPHVTLRVAAVLFGVQLLVHGLYRVIQAAGSREVPMAARASMFALGLLSMLVGLLCVVRVATTIFALALLVGLFWIVSGISQLSMAAAGHGRERALTVLSGLLGVVAGVIVIAWPHASLTVLTVVLGWWLIVLGCLGLGIGWRLRSS